MQTFINIIIFLLGLSLLIMIHEVGHFVAAKLFKVYCHEFSIGMGPAIISKKGKETKYSIRCLPIGGYVLMAGESIEDNKEKTNSEVEHAKDEPQIEVPAERTINGIVAWKRFIIMFAGVLMNFVLAFFLFFGYVMGAPAIGVLGPTVAVAQKDDKGAITPFKASGLQSGDNITSVQSSFLLNGVEIFLGKVIETKSFDDFYQNIGVPAHANENDENGVADDFFHLPGAIYTDVESGGMKATFESQILVQMLTITVKNDKEEVNVYSPKRHIYSVTVYEDLKDSPMKYQIKEINLQYWGFGQLTRKAKSIGEGISVAAQLEYENGILIFKAIGQLFTKKGVEQVGGVIAMYGASTEFASYGVPYYIAFLGLISVNLGVMNLLPIPGLDGSHLLIIIIEGITRKKIPAKTKAIINFIGLIFLMGLMVLVTAKDIFSLFK